MAMPPLSLTGTLDASARWVPEALVSPEARERARRLLSRFPAALSYWLYLESPLGCGGSRADVIFSVTRENRHLLAGLDPRSGLDPAWRGAHPAWARVHDLYTAWSRAGSVVEAAIERIWLEFDLPEEAGEVPVPGVFVDFTRPAYLDGTPAERLERACACLEPLLGGPVEPTVRARLARCYDAIPEGGKIVYLGLFPSRQSPDIRICVQGLSDEAIFQYLRDVEWPGTAAGLERAMRPFAREDGRSVGLLDLDVGDRVRGKVGLEYRLNRASQVRGLLREGELLDALQRAGVCSEAERRGAEEWPGIDFAVLPHQFWGSIITRRLNHFKVMYEPGAPLQAKAYLSLSHKTRVSGRPVAAAVPVGAATAGEPWKK